MPENIGSKYLELDSVKIEGQQFYLEHRQGLLVSPQLELIENDTVVSILKGGMVGDSLLLKNYVSGEVFQLSRRKGKLFGSNLVLRVDKSKERFLDYNLAVIKHDIFLDTTANKISGTFDTLPYGSVVEFNTLAKKNGAANPFRAVRSKNIDLSFETKILAASAKIISRYGWYFDFEIPLCCPKQPANSEGI